MNFRQLEYVIAVEEEGHFRKAAQRCCVSQATLSEMIRRLEDELDILIFDRSRNPVVPTYNGKQVISKSREIINRSKELIHLKSALEGRLSGVLRIGIIPTVAPLLLPKIIKPFKKKYPDIELKIKEATTDQLISDLESERIDAAILATNPSDKDFTEYPLYSEALKVYGIQDEHKKRITTKEIKKSTVWLLEDGHCFKDQVVSVCGLEDQSNQFDGLEMQCSSFATLVGLVDDFGGYTLLPELYVRIMSSKRQNKTRAFESPEPFRKIRMMVYRPFVKKAHVSALTALIRSSVKSNL
tara:strand:- start:3424 stop:4317 length:894 start_codon:yes stop_codon:yes gene_type:complete